MTAMIDVVFLLLVFFLWTSSFEEPEFDFASGLSMPPVGNAGESTKPSESVLFDEIVVRLVQSPSGLEIRFNGESLDSIATLRSRLVSVASLGAQAAVIVDPDAEVTMESSIAAYDAARAAGFDRVLFAVKK